MVKVHHGVRRSCGKNQMRTAQQLNTKSLRRENRRLERRTREAERRTREAEIRLQGLNFLWIHEITRPEAPKAASLVHVVRWFDGWDGK
jgi:hypothetical protein